MGQPRARVEVVRDTHFGVTVEDPYRWMEDWRGAELRAWVEAQGAYTRAYLDRLPEREPLFRRISQLSEAAPILSSFALAQGRTFYLRRDTGENVARLIVREGPEGREDVLVDPGEREDGTHAVIDWFYPSRDGSLVAYGISEGGSEQSVLHVLEVASGRVLDERIPGTTFGSVEWMDDNRSFLYHRLSDPAPGAAEADKYRDSHMYLHRLGQDVSADVPVFGRGVNPRVELSRDDVPFIVLSPRSDWMLGIVEHGAQPELAMYAAPLAALGNPASIPWVQVVSVADGVTAAYLETPAVFAGDTLYVRTHSDAPRYRVVALDLHNPNMDLAREVVPHSERIVQGLRLAGEYLLVRDIDAGIGRLRRVPLSGGEPEEIELPMRGAIDQWAASPESGETVLRLSSWISPPAVYRLHADHPQVTNTGWAPPAPVDVSQVEVRETEYRARDGIVVPISIIHRKGLQLDGSNPTVLMGYGSYGMSFDPSFLPNVGFNMLVWLAWYERGGVLAIAHIRGGGELGREWHEAGRFLNKGNTVNDFVDAAEYLVEAGYTRPERLAGWGISAGGIPSGGGLTQRPDLWAAMVLGVAVTNFLRFEVSENGPANVPEFGSVATEEGFRGLQIVDSYTKIKHGVAYPAALITTGLNDPRVVVWQAAKLAARLQAATSSGRPVLLRVEEQGGHGAIASSRKQMDAELADTLAFLLEQFQVGAGQEVAAGASREG